MASAKAELQRAQAVLYRTRLTANRYAQLVKTNAISKQNNDDAQAAYKQAQAAVAAAEAGLKNAQINLDYTTVRSPISGRIGRSLVTPGALLSAHQAQNMAVVQTLDPIYVDVTQSSKEILSLKKDIRCRQTENQRRRYSRDLDHGRRNQVSSDRRTYAVRSFC